MTKEDLAWVLIRFTGIVLIIIGTISLLVLVPTTISMLSMSDALNYGHGLSDQQLQEMARSTRTATFSILRNILPTVAGYLIVGLYFLFGGKWVFKLITRSS